MMRIVSLLPASTEIVFALGLGGHLVGRSHECDFPRRVTGLPALTRPKFDSGRASGQINRTVRALLEKGLSVYDVDVDLLQSLQPDVIITQSQCEACSVDFEAIEKAAATLLDGQPQLIDLQSRDLGSVWDDIRKIGRVTGKQQEADQLVGEMKETMAHISEIAISDNHTPQVAILEWLDPLMNAANWMPELVAMANATPLFTRDKAEAKSQILVMEQLRKEDPGYLLISPCGFSITQTKREIKILENSHGWDQLQAVRNQKVFIADGHQHFNRPGPRLTESLRILAEILHPAQFDPLFEAEGWEKYKG